MKSKREEYSAWFDNRRGPRDPKIEKEILVIASIYDEIQESQILSDGQLQLIVDGASSSNGLMWNSVSALLRKLVEQWPSAGEAIVRMSQSPKANVRFSAICSLGKGTPAHISDSVLKAGLIDKAAKVRSKAGERADMLNKVNLVPNLEAAHASETNELVKKSLELSLRMLRDGYWVKTRPDGQTTITVKKSNGISSRFVSEEELKTKGVDNVVEELRRR
jgi:hypothetical protein